MPRNGSCCYVCPICGGLCFQPAKANPRRRQFPRKDCSRRLQGVVARDEPYDIVHRTLYHVHQRVATTYRAGRIFLAGDAAHLNNPLGGMGMNGGIHDALNLTSKLLRVRDGEDEALFDAYTRERQPIAVEYVQAQAERNRQLLRERDDAVRMEGFRDLQATAADPARARKFLLRSSMIESLQKAEAAV